jgi:hypothetical protein
MFTSIDQIQQVFGGKDYKLQISDTIGCRYSETTFLNLKQGVFASVAPDSVEGRSPFMFTFKNTTVGDSILNFTYNFGDGTDAVTVLNTLKDTLDNDTFSHEYKADVDTTFSFIIQAKSELFEQCDDYDTIVVTIRVPVNVKTYNVLSLGDDNSDNKNNAFRINPSGVLDVTCVIFDRWGNKVKDFSDKGGYTWDGVIWDNIESAAGTYYYVLNYTIKKDSIRQPATPITGFIQIVR